ncbi:12-diacylglycerol 3-glucosyltransferase protein [Salinisphaera shabanensis E1L3A]|uniref:12-diacylglycerol 3-glucosyltransferase protein n=2 Tax=Salinisphaera shabanensis TaxID=180542 RepID=U2FVJ4_9GAMM|nr:12-diacylglycerol 3-glucosyltransferase protein [Salinisphaera shabanensis E1L3A]
MKRLGGNHSLSNRADHTKRMSYNRVVIDTAQRNRHKTRMNTPSSAPGHVAVYCPDLGGGVAHIALAQIDILQAAGHTVDLLLHRDVGEYRAQVPADVRILTLESADSESIGQYMRRALSGHPMMRIRARYISPNRLTDLEFLPALVDYLETRQPVLLLANVWNTVLVAACACAAVQRSPRLIGLFHGTFFAEAAQRRSARKHPWRWRHFYAFCRHFYSQADALASVSDGVGQDLVRIVGVAHPQVETLSNPVVSPRLAARAAEPVTHAWLQSDAPPLIVAVGRLSPEKNHALLLHAFARLRASRPDVRLAILGEGSERTHLESLRDELGLTECVLMPGWVDNPHAWMARATMVALSSNWEGLGNVLIEALACGVPVVATDCPHGPREVLDHGRYGRLVPVNDVDAFASAIEQTLDADRNSDLLIARAQHYSVAAATQRYRALVQRVLAGSL